MHLPHLAPTVHNLATERSQHNSWLPPQIQCPDVLCVHLLVSCSRHHAVHAVMTHSGNPPLCSAAADGGDETVAGGDSGLGQLQYGGEFAVGYAM